MLVALIRHCGDYMAKINKLINLKKIISMAVENVILIDNSLVKNKRLHEIACLKD